MKNLIPILILTFTSSLSFAVPCTNLDIKTELVKKFTELNITSDLSPCDLSKKSVEFNSFAIALISESCPSSPDVNSAIDRYQQVRNHAEDLVKEYCGH